jgi:hypothetical protein
VLYPELEGKMSGTPVLTERLVTEGCWLRLVWTLKNCIHESNFSSWCVEYGDLLQLVEENTIKIADVLHTGDI